MKEAKTIKQYVDRIMAVVNNIRLLGEQFTDSRVVENVITTLFERLDIQYRSCTQFGHMEKVCKNKGRTPQQNVQAQTAKRDHIQEEQVFAATSSTSKNRVAMGWLIDSGCTNHMTSDKSILGR
ncbi:Retrovirus-related Pol polyprotein from transposon TNT 1-94 [Gossypium australe]|uniref:Retrovirus-related Pol polyprotein from transposon TNT 1-94 n=1 Tax=Gossypium australe TaxID=47621 RepID=A0A5B6W4Z9_9ROSI|nr:Retrovirus-related Pol polyprotein from transposon TNT 1-94 [Gossypium australe]